MTPLMEVREVSKSFTSGDQTLDVLTGISFTVAEGEFLSVVGQSGAGKSTLLHIMGALDHPTGGSLLFEGKDVFSRRGADLDLYRNRSVGFIFQFHHLLPDFTALENVMLPPLAGRMARSAARAEAVRLLEEVGLAERMDHKPGQLSGGEQQRVAVARALVMSPKIVLADEPTGNLDAKNSLAVFSLLQEINRRRRLSVVMVTHNRELADATDRVMTLSAGLIA